VSLKGYSTSTLHQIKFITTLAKRREDVSKRMRNLNKKQLENDNYQRYLELNGIANHYKLFLP
jgi:hypothetical protein